MQAPAGGQVFTLTTGPDNVNGGAGGNNLVQATTATLSTNDVIDAGSGGSNTLALQYAGVFDLRAPTTLTDIQTITAQEGQASSVLNGHTYATSVQTVYLRNGLNAAVNVAPGTPNPGNPKPSTITIIGATNSDVITLANGNDAVTMGLGETLHGGTGNNTIYVTASTIGDQIDGGTGTNTLSVSGGGAMNMATVAHISAVTLGLATSPYQFLANAQSGLTVTDGSNLLDTITAGGANQTLAGGAAGKLTMVGNTNTTFKDTAALFNGDDIQNFAIGDIIDITGLGFTSVGNGPGQTSLTFVENGGNTAGTLAVLVGGVQKTAITLNGVYDQSKFTLGSDGGTGTAVGYHV